MERDSINRFRSDGSLYYVRLETHCGIFYKIGFTTLESVHERFSYGGSSDWKYIDKILLFVSHPNALAIEKKLHAYLYEKRAFGKYSASKNFPLAKNGQTELYIEDVLELDSEYTDNQRKRTTQHLKSMRSIFSGKSPERDSFEDLIVNIVVRVVATLLSPIAVIIIILSSITEGKSIKVELLDLIDRLTGGKKAEAQKEKELKIKIRAVKNELDIGEPR
jgi:hypothetical protein